MKSEMRLKVLVAVARHADEHADRIRRRRGAIGQPRDAGELRLDRRHRAAVGGDVHRARQGVDPSALRQLPSGRRPPAPGRRGPAAPAAGRARRGRSWPRRPCAAPSATRRPTSIPAACRAIRSGISRRVKWRGKARRSARSACRSRIPKRNGGRSLAELIHHIGEDTLVGWAWAPGYGRQPAPGTQKQAGALVEAWVKTGAACPREVDER